jgi:serine/threonine protein kinase
VELAQNVNTGEKCALKVMKRRYSPSCNLTKIFENEVEALSRLDHPNILKLIDFSSNEQEPSPKNKVAEVNYLALEYAENGEMFEYISNTGSFSEPTARYYFHQLISAVNHINDMGLAHRDIKPENIMLDAEFNLKLADFGFATDQDTSTRTQGTVRYMAPELIANLQYKPKQVDLFASAVILFTMVTQRFPFKSAEPSDELYQFIILKDFIGFWHAHSEIDPSTNDLSEEFKDLFCGMVIVDGEERTTIEDVMVHNWYNGCLLSHQEIFENFTNRKLIKDVKHKIEETSDKGCKDSVSPDDKDKSMITMASTTDHNLLKKLKKLTKIHTDYYECENGDLLMNEIVNFSKKYKYSHKV